MVASTVRDRREGIREGYASLFNAKRPIIASNRGPFEHRLAPDGSLEASRGCGGLITALAAMTRVTPVTWVACAMTEADRQAAQIYQASSLSPSDGEHWAGWAERDGAQALGLRSELALSVAKGLARRSNGHTMQAGEVGEDDLRLRLVVPAPEQFHLYYSIFCNPVLWFLQHSLWDELDRPNLWQEVPDAWRGGYLPVNQAFARAILAELARPDTAPLVMLHDYHLYAASAYIRARAPEAVLTQFVHIPWPGPEVWQNLPVPIVASICRGLLANDIVGFQSVSSAHNFLLTCFSFFHAAEVDFEDWAIRHEGRLTRVRCYPISVDVEGLRQLMVSPEVQGYRERLGPLVRRHTIVRVDRLDPSKNILAGFQAFELLLEEHPELLGQVKFLAFLVPSRTDIPEYQRYAQSVLSLIEEINRRYGTGEWCPVEVFYENNYAQALAGMSLADVLLVNPLADGMNLVAKEGPMVNERDGVLALSRAAGAFHELGDHAVPINPTSVAGTARALAEALFMPVGERRSRAANLRRAIEAGDLSHWLSRQLEDIASLGMDGRRWTRPAEGHYLRASAGVR